MQALKRLALAAAALLAAAAGELLREVSFEKPFELMSPEGQRIAGLNWNQGGATAVNRHFIRLTPDRQSRRGFVWSKKKIEAREFSIVLTFRISGQAKSWFGDGLALWVTTSQQHQDGDNHGFKGDFTGFGVLFDTFVNSEHPGGHQDVTLFVNDGSKSLDQLNDEKKVGCMAPGIRYHERNAGFSPSLNMSRAKIQYKDNYVAILVDAKNTGDWVHCYGGHVNLGANWVDDATIGLTASTGGLADNHDIIALKVYECVAAAPPLALYGSSYVQDLNYTVCVLVIWQRCGRHGDRRGRPEGEERDAARPGREAEHRRQRREVAPA